MSLTLGVVELLPPCAPEAGTPLFGIARRHFAGKPLLEWVVRRAQESQLARRVVVVARDTPQCRVLAQCTPPDVEVIFTEASDALGGLASVCRKIPCHGVVRMNVAQPFVDPTLIDRLAAAVRDTDCDFAGYCFQNGTPVLESKLGFFAEWIRASALLDADQRARGSEREAGTQYLVSHPERYALKFLPCPGKLEWNHVRLAIEDENDWENVQTIFDALGPECLDWQFITNLLERHPEMREKFSNSAG